MGIGTATPPNGRRRTLIALLTATAALTASAYALAPASALAYQEVDPDCMGAICPVAGDGGAPAGDPAGDPTDGSGSGGFEFEHEAPHDADDGSSNASQYGDHLLDQLPDPSLFQLVDNPQSGAGRGWRPGDPVEQLVEPDSPEKRQREADDWVKAYDRWAQRAAREIQDHDPDDFLWDFHNCDDKIDPLRCGVVWIFNSQANKCERIETERKIHIETGHDLSEAEENRLEQCIVEEEMLYGLWRDRVKLGHMKRNYD
jgi:hypothetical protein